MRRLVSHALAAALVLISTSSCTDTTSPSKLHPGQGNRDIDLTVGSVAVDLLYNGVSIGQNPMGDHCFNLAVDGQSVAGLVCGTTTIPNLTAGSHAISLQQTIISPPPGPPTINVDIQPPVTVTITGGQTTPLSFELSSARGEVAGTLTVNGQPAPDGQYEVCVDSGHCTFLQTGGMPPAPPTPPTGKFLLLAKPGTGQGFISGIAGTSHLADFPYTVTAGQLVDVGTLNIALASVAVDLRFNGVTIGQNPMGDHCFNLAVDGQSVGGQLCAPTTVPNLPAGTHTISLQQTVIGTPPGPPTINVDIQPPVTVTLTGGQTTPVNFELSSVRAEVSGTLMVNGQPAPDGQYQVCVDSGHCNFLSTGGMPPAPPTPPTGRFLLLAKPGTGQGFISGIGAFNHLADFPYTAAAGQLVDVGTVTIALASVSVDLLFNGVTIGQHPMGDHCFNLAIDGQSLSGLLCSPNTVQNLPAGTHSISLQQTIISPPPGPPTSTVDILPPVTITLVAGQTTPVSFELSSVRGQVAGTLNVNGQPAPDGQYQVCVDSGHCDFLSTGGLPPAPPTPPTGKFVLLAKPGPGQGFISGIGAFNHLADFSFIVAKGLTTLIGGISTAPPGDTPSGSGVAVEPVNQTTGTANTTITLDFSNVATGGTTTVIQSTQGAPLPTGLQLGAPPVFFDLSTTATFTGPVEVCINYTGTTFADPSNARLLHGDGAGNWTDVTTTHDQANRIICGSVTSFSPFVVAQRTAPPPPPAQKPTITPAIAGTLNANGWYTSDVVVTWNLADNGTPITTQTGCASAQITSNTAGTTITCSATSAGGTSSSSVTIKRDANSPVVTPSLSGTIGANGWYTSDVGVSWSVTNLGPSSATSSCTASSVTTDTPGVGFSCSATSGAGLTGSNSVTVKRDATRPAIAYAGGLPSYTVDQTVTITCSASDATSGLASNSCADIAGPAYGFAASNSYSAQAVDVAGNSNTAQATFTVKVTGAGVTALIVRFVPEIGSQKALTAILNAILDAIAKEKPAVKAAQINAFLNLLNVAKARGVISAGNVAVLTAVVKLL